MDLYQRMARFGSISRKEFSDKSYVRPAVETKETKVTLFLKSNLVFTKKKTIEMKIFHPRGQSRSPLILPLKRYHRKQFNSLSRFKERTGLLSSYAQIMKGNNCIALQVTLQA